MMSNLIILTHYGVICVLSLVQALPDVIKIGKKLLYQKDTFFSKQKPISPGNMKPLEHFTGKTN